VLAGNATACGSLVDLSVVTVDTMDAIFSAAPHLPDLPGLTALELRGGICHYHGASELEPQPEWLDLCRTLPLFSSLQSLSLGPFDFSHMRLLALMTGLAGCTALTQLHLHGEEKAVGSEEEYTMHGERLMGGLAAMKSLRVLRISGLCFHPPDGFQNVLPKLPHLQELRLPCCRVRTPVTHA